MLKTYYHALWGLSFLAGFAPGIESLDTGQALFPLQSVANRHNSLASHLQPL